MTGFTLCFTGISGSGKSTLAIALEKQLCNKNKIQVIDGDILRAQLGNLFGYTKMERMKNSMIVRVLSKYLNDNGINTIVSIVAPYEQMRAEIRKFIGDRYIEVYLKCSYEECVKRDVKGYYKEQSEGQIKNLNGADDVFEVPLHSEIVIDTEQETIDNSVNKILFYLEEKGYAI